MKKIYELFISHKTQFKNLGTANRTNAVSKLLLLSQNVVDVPKMYHYQEKHVKPVYNENTLFFANSTL